MVDCVRSMGHSPKVLVLRSDSERIYTDGPMKELCDSAGYYTMQQFSPPYQKQSAHLGENVWKVLGMVNRSIVINVDFPLDEWDLSYPHANLLKNLWPKKRRSWQIPYYTVHGQHFNMSLLKVFGSKVVERSLT